MKVLIYKNADFLARYSGKVVKEVMVDAEQRTKELLKQHIASQTDDEIESEAEELMDLYKLDAEDKGRSNNWQQTTTIVSCYFRLSCCRLQLVVVAAFDDQVPSSGSGYNNQITWLL